MYSERMQERVAAFNRRKRIFDVAIIMLTSPITVPIGCAVALLTLIQQGRPVVFRQKRAGYRGKVFLIFKFRTMSDVRDKNGNLLPDEKRLTRVGAFLRRTSLDEVPQLLNILVGDMSFVGPRPLYPHYLAHYTEHEATRHCVRPGLTGLAQVSGRNGVPWDSRLALDAHYVSEASLLLDFRILLRTVAKVLRPADVNITPGTTGGRHFNMYRSFPTFEHYRLRCLERDDLKERVRWISDPATREYMSIVGDVTMQTTQKWFEDHMKNPVKHDFAIVDDESAQLVAMVGMHDEAPRKGLTYVMVNPDCRGRGIGAVAQRLLYEWAFTHRGYAEVFSSVHKDNGASVRIHTKLGATPVEETDERFLLRQTEEQFLSATGRKPGIPPL
jgi:lipopolysaccharide/colanic/teichoic acid biosynthesis glycosyltransferase/RimJ/RimL family protein N-acetyltransferase